MEKRKTAEVLAAECIAAQLRLINRVVTSIYDEGFRPHGVRVSQMNILSVIALLGEASPRQISTILFLDKSTLSRNLGRMRRRGWLDTSSQGAGRVLFLKLTPDGERVLDEAFPAWERAQQRVVSLIGGDDVAALVRIAHKLSLK
jgi:DNA-binding MarR family transcriptional regulator